MLTPEQSIARRKYIGSSDAPALMGVDPYRSASDVYLEKTGIAEGFAGNEHTERGNLLEPVVLTWAARQLSGFIERDVMFSGGHLCVNLDAHCPNEFSVEAKTATNADEWGEQGTDQVPERVIIQCHHGFAITGYRLAYVPVLLPVFGRFEFRMYRVERDDALASAVAEHGERFWREHVQARVPPADFRPSLEVLRRVRRVPEKVVPIPGEFVDKFVAARAARYQAEDAEDAARRDLLAVLDDAEGGQCEDGRLVTYLETKRKGYVVEDTSFRTLRVKQPAKEQPCQAQ